MTDRPLIESLDFHKPRRPGLTSFRLLHRWWSEACQRVNESWGMLLAQNVQLSSQSIETVNWLGASELIPGDGITASLRLAETEIPALVCLSNRQVRGLLADLLNQSGIEWPEPKGITPVERSMLEVLSERLATGLGGAWPGEQELPCRFIKLVERPQRLRLFPPGASLMMGRLAVTSRFGVDEVLWLIPKERIEELISEQVETQSVQDQSVIQNLNQLTERLPVQVSIQLGRTTLNVTEIAELAIGDMLILDQSPFDELIAHVQKEEKWRGRPVKIGHRLGFAITDLVNR